MQVKFYKCELTGTRPIHFTNNVRHTRFVAHIGSQVRRLTGVIFRERLHFAAMAFAAFARQEAQRTMTRSGELPVRLWKRGRER